MRSLSNRAAFVAFVLAAVGGLAVAQKAPAASARPDGAPGYEAFATALPQLRLLAEAGDWEALCRAFAPFGSLPPPPPYRRVEVEDRLRGLRDLLGVPPRVPTDAGTKGLVADLLGADAAAAVHYREHIDHATRDVFGDKSSFVGYLAIFALRRRDLEAARTLLTEQIEVHKRTRPQADPVERAPIERLLRAVDDLRAAPHDPWRRLAFLRVYRANAWPPYQMVLWEVQRELQRLAESPDTAGNAALRCALRCEEFVSWPAVSAGDSARDERALATARACVDGGLPAAAGKRRDVADPWSPIHEMGSMLWKAGDAARAVVAFDAVTAPATAPAKGPALVNSAASVPNLVHDALVLAAECKLALGRHADALADLVRAEREFPFQTDCGTCRWGEQARIQALRAKIEAGAKPK